jgi:hypothetical protein
MPTVIKSSSPAPAASISTCDSMSDSMRVAKRNGEFHVVALQLFEAGEPLMTIEGDLVAAPCRYSVQVGRFLHIAPPAGVTREDGHDRYFWRFLNHSCRPNAAVVGKAVVAIKSISSGEEITFDYNANEYDMAAPFRCHCGHCGGVEVRGFKHLNAAERQHRQKYLAEHLRDRIDEHD